MRLRLARELLDEDQGTPEEIRRSLRDLWWINQHLGGLSSWRRLLGAWGAMPPGPPAGLTLLDLGSGTGEMAAALAAELRRRGWAVRAWALDRRLSHLGAGPGRLAADALRLPLADAAVDVVTCNLFLHHFHGDAAACLLREMARVARRAVLINDLERAWIPYAAIRLLSPRFSRITRHDGPRSVAQAYTLPELRRLAAAALPAWHGRALRLWPYRLGLILERDGG
jgi:SAM-dependent methyltransferase